MSLVLVTGASGFLGSHVVEAAARAGHDVVAAARDPASSWRLAALARAGIAFRAHAFDLLRPESLAVPRGASVIHCAAYAVDPRQRDARLAVRTNVDGAVALAEAAIRDGARHLVHVGTGYEFGDQRGSLPPDAPLAPRGLYARTKAAGALAASEVAREAGLPFALARPFAMYGPREDQVKLVPQVLRALARHERIELTRGEQLRDYAYVGDVAHGLVRLAESAARGGFNLGSGEPTTLRAFVEAVARAVGGDELLLAFGARPYGADEVMSSCADVRAAEKAIGWRVTTDIAQGARATAGLLAARAVGP